MGTRWRFHERDGRFDKGARAREVPERKEGVDLTEKVLNAVEALLPRLVDFIIDVATIAVLPTLLTLLALVLLQRPVFDFLETALMLVVTTAVALMIANAKTRLLQKLRLRFR
jgi:hypothetical protein